MIKPTLGFQSRKTAYATIKGFELMRMFRKKQLESWTDYKDDNYLFGEIKLINEQFGIFEY